jgi:cytochrome c peroxidase
MWRMWRYPFLTLPLAVPAGLFTLSLLLGAGSPPGGLASEPAAGFTQEEGATHEAEDARAVDHAQEKVKAQTDPRIRVPFGLDPFPPAELAGFRPKVAALGRQLFFDPILSVDRQTSCGSCHQPDHGFASPEKLPKGSLGKRALRHAPSLVNRAYGTQFSWDGKTDSLEVQVLLPIENPNEMALPIEDAIRRLAGDKTYAKRFKDLFKRPPQKADLARALTSYVQTLLTGNSVIDRFHAGQDVNLEVAEKAGMWIFESKGGCWKCHSGANFSDESFHNTGIGVREGKAEPGRGGLTSKEADWGGFKTPTLRGLPQTAPYMHDGSLATLEDVVEFYRRGGNKNSGLDPKVQPLDLSDEEVGFLVAFLRALSRPSDYQEGKDRRQQDREGRRR